MKRPTDVKFLKSHEWVRLEGDTAVVGITDYAVKHLSDLVYLDLPDLGTDVMANEPFGEIESVKAVSDLYCPITGEVIEHNEEVQGNLDILKKDPFGAGWMVRLRVEKVAEFDDLLDAEGYEQSIKAAEAEQG